MEKLQKKCMKIGVVLDEEQESRIPMTCLYCQLDLIVRTPNPTKDPRSFVMMGSCFDAGEFGARWRKRGEKRDPRTNSWRQNRRIRDGRKQNTKIGSLVTHFSEAQLIAKLSRRDFSC